jgi:hypothetical protein
MSHQRERAPAERKERPERDSPAPAAPAERMLASPGFALEGLGNRALLALYRSGQLQRKAPLSQPEDPREHAADRAAEAIVNGDRPTPQPSGSGRTEVQRMPSSAAVMPAAAAPGPTLTGQLSGGNALDEQTRGLMESRFGESFDDVRIHTGHRAGEMADAVRARAFTVGSDIVFGAGEFAPGTTEGTRLLAHELAHVVQQRRPTGAVAGEKATERDAHEAANAVASGSKPAVRERAAAGVVQKEGGQFAPKWILAWPGKKFGTEIPILAQEPGRNDSETVGFLSAANGSSLSVMETLAYEDGGESGHDTLTVSLGVSGDVGVKRESPTIRWPHVHLHVYPWSPQLPEPVEPHLPKPTPSPKQPRVIPRPIPPKHPLPNPQLGIDPPQQEPRFEDPKPAAPTVDRSRPQAATDKLREALAKDSSKVGEAASQLSNRQLADLDFETRLAAIRVLAQQGSGADAATLLNLLSSTPDADAGTVLDTLKADNDKLLRELLGTLPSGFKIQLEMSMFDLAGRRADQPKFILPNTQNPPIDWQGLLQEPQRDPNEVLWVGNPLLRPSWTKGLKVWKDAQGRNNLFSPELGLTTYDRNGKRLNLPVPGQEMVERFFKAEGELQAHGGKPYVEGKGALDPDQWKAHIEERIKATAPDVEREIQNLSGAVDSWKDNQKGDPTLDKLQWVLPPAGLANKGNWGGVVHMFGNTSTDAPDRILKSASQDVAIARQEMRRARTATELKEAEQHLYNATRRGASSFFGYKEKVYVGGERTITGIKVGAATATAVVSAPVLFSYGGAAVTFKVVAGGALVGSGLSAGRQGVEMWEGTRAPKDFSWGEVGLGGAMGAGLAFFPEFAPLMVGMGVQSSADEFAQGHWKLGAFDALSTAVPIGLHGVSGPSAGRWIRTRSGAVFMRMSTAVGDVPGLGGRNPMASSLGYESVPMLVPGASGRSSPFMVPELGASRAPSGGNWRTVDFGGTGLPDYGIPKLRIGEPPVSANPQAAAPGSMASPATKPSPSGQLSLFDLGPPTVAQTPQAPIEPKAPAADPNFVYETEGGFMVPRQTSLLDIRPSVRGGTNRTWYPLMKFIFHFEPKANSTHEMNGVSYRYDSEKRLVRVSSDKNMKGERFESSYKDEYPKIPGFDYGHVGSVKEFGTKDVLLGPRGGFPQEANFNRSGAWRVAEERVFVAACQLEGQGKPFLKVAEVRNFVDGVPSEWRAYVESEGKLVYDSGWLKAPMPGD